MAVPSCHMLRPAEARSTPRPNPCRRQQAWTLEECDLSAASPPACRFGRARKVPRAMFAKSQSDRGNVPLDFGRSWPGPSSRPGVDPCARADGHVHRHRRVHAARRERSRRPLVARLLRSHFRLLAQCIESERRPHRQDHGRRADRGLGRIPMPSRPAPPPCARPSRSGRRSRPTTRERPRRGQPPHRACGSACMPAR